MKDWWTRIGIVALLVIIVGVPMALHKAQTVSVRSRIVLDHLVIVSPHSEQIRYEFGRAFNLWRRVQGKPCVEIDWRTSGGTSDMRRMVIDEFAAEARIGRVDEGIGNDLFFGGGEYDHNKLAAGVEIILDGRKHRVQIVQVPYLPEGLIREAFPEPMIGGEALYHPQFKWIGTALASFGIVYNRDVLEMLGLDDPLTWSDLSDPRYRGWVAVADPAHSGSIKATYNVILRRLGWDAGWKALRRVFANTRYFTSSASKIPVDVSTGEAAAGMCIDFYGRFQAEAIARAVGPNPRVGYVDPPFQTAITADPITLLRGAPNKKTAEQFIAWLLSKSGQGLWQRRRGAEGGPEKFELRRLPIRRDLYTPEEQLKWTDADIAPFQIAKPFPEGMPDMFATVAVVSHAMAIDIHEDLVAAWDTIVQNPKHPRRDRMLEYFDAMPSELKLRWPDAALAWNWREAIEDTRHPRHDEVAKVLVDLIKGLTDRWRLNPDQRIDDRLRWTLFFRDKYRQVVALEHSG